MKHKIINIVHSKQVLIQSNDAKLQIKLNKCTERSDKRSLALDLKQKHIFDLKIKKWNLNLIKMVKKNDINAFKKHL